MWVWVTPTGEMLDRFVILSLSFPPLPSLPFLSFSLSTGDEPDCLFMRVRVGLPGGFPCRQSMA